MHARQNDKTFISLWAATVISTLSSVLKLLLCVHIIHIILYETWVTYSDYWIIIIVSFAIPWCSYCKNNLWAVPFILPSGHKGPIPLILCSFVHYGFLEASLYSVSVLNQWAVWQPVYDLHAYDAYDEHGLSPCPPLSLTLTYAFHILIQYHSWDSELAEEVVYIFLNCHLTKVPHRSRYCGMRMLLIQCPWN